jgi:hypothetical protein
MAKTKIDELNILSDSSEPFDYEDFIEHYFDPMQISNKQKKERRELANELMDIILYFLIWCEEFPEQVQTEDVQREFENQFKEKVFGYSEPSTFFDVYVPKFISQLIETTLKHKGEEYFTSVERAANVAVNESNTVFGHNEMETAKALGKTKKRWCTELDERVRPTHVEAEGLEMPIDEPFLVGDSLLLYPKDTTYDPDPKEIVNCRCVCKYS